MALTEFLRRHTRFKKHISEKVVENKILFFDEMNDFDKGAVYCWTGNKKESLTYFSNIIEDIKNIDNYSSIALNPIYRPYMDEVYQTMYHHKMKEEYLKNALFSKVYLSLHFLTPYIAVQECEKIENIIEKAALIKDKESFKMALLEQKAHSYINMGALRNSESILQELLAILIYKPNSMDSKTKFDLYDKLTNLNLKYNNLAIATNYNQLAFRTAEELNDHKLLALAEITYAKIHLYREIAKSKKAISRADEHLSVDKDPRIQCHNNLSKIVIALLEEFKNSNLKKDLLKDTLSLLHEAENKNYANSVIRGYLLAATIIYFEDLDHALKLSNMGIDAGIRWGQANYMWHFYNLKALISLRKKDSSDYVQKLFNTVLHLLQKQNLLYLGTLDFTYENILALSNVLSYWQNVTAESDFYQKISGVSYSNSIFSCNYNCDNEICNFNCIQTTDIYKKEYKKIKSGKLPFITSDYSYPGKDSETGFYLLFC